MLIICTPQACSSTVACSRLNKVCGSIAREFFKVTYRNTFWAKIFDIYCLEKTGKRHKKTTADPNQKCTVNIDQGNWHVYINSIVSHLNHLCWHVCLYLFIMPEKSLKCHALDWEPIEEHSLKRSTQPLQLPLNSVFVLKSALSVVNRFPQSVHQC